MSYNSNLPSLTNQLPTTINFPAISNSPQEFQDNLETLLRTVCYIINQKEGGLYNLVEQASAMQYFRQSNPQQFRNAYRLTMDFVNLNGGNIAASATISFPHNIDGIKESAGITANCTATDGRIFTVVYPNVWVTATNAFFVNPVAVPLSQCDVVINILKEV